MKKIISIICICSLILGLFQVVYAGSEKVKDHKNIPDRKITEENNGYKEENKNDDNKKITKEVKDLNEQIKKKNEEIVELRHEIRDITMSIREKINKLSSEGVVMTQAEVSDLQTVLSLVKGSKKVIRDFKTDGLKQSISEGKNAKDKKELTNAQKYMKKTIELQENRKESFNDAINDLKKAEDLLLQYEEVN